MSRGVWGFKKTEVRRLVEAAKKAGVQVARVEYDPANGKIALITGDRDRAVSEATNENEWDRV